MFWKGLGREPSFEILIVMIIATIQKKRYTGRLEKIQKQRIHNNKNEENILVDSYFYNSNYMFIIMNNSKDKKY